MRFTYTITEYDENGDEIHRQEEVDAHVRFGDVEDYARGLVTDWVPVEPAAETWQARVRDEDGNRAEASFPDLEVRRIEPTPPPDPQALIAQLDPLTSGLRRIAEPLALDEELPALYRLLPQAADLIAGVQYAIGTAGDPYGTGRANLETVQARAQHLAATVAQALADERAGRNGHR